MVPETVSGHLVVGQASLLVPFKDKQGCLSYDLERRKENASWV
jgi:hypothetical protein